MIHSHRTAVLLLLVGLTGCDGDPHPADAGVDAGPAPLDAGTDAGPDEPDAGPPCDGPPGLYGDARCEVVDVGVRAYETRFELWADDADKERYIYLPPDATVDTSDPNEWVFPVGTRVYKTFLHDGVRLETRVFEKTDPGTGVGAWDMRAYAWNEAQNAVEDVTNEPGSVRENVLGTEHDIPSGADCVRCHGGRDVVNGFSAIMLNHDGDGVTLERLVAENLLTDPIDPADAEVPGDASAVAALGYLHANCGNCHRETTGDPATARLDLRLWLQVGAASVEATETYTTTVGRAATFFDPDAVCRIHPGQPDTSLMVVRMESRGGSLQMPPLATEQVHAEGASLMRAWVASLSGDAPDCVP